MCHFIQISYECVSSILNPHQKPPTVPKITSDSNHEKISAFDAVFAICTYFRFVSSIVCFAFINQSNHVFFVESEKWCKAPMLSHLKLIIRQDKGKERICWRRVWGCPWKRHTIPQKERSPAIPIINLKSLGRQGMIWDWVWPSAVAIVLLKSLPQHRPVELKNDSGISRFSTPISKRSSSNPTRLGSPPVWWKIVFKCRKFYAIWRSCFLKMGRKTRKSPSW